MNNRLFPWIATGVGLVLLTTLLLTGATSPERNYSLPLLTMLFMSELGAVISGVGAFIGFRFWQQQRGNVALLFVGMTAVALAVSLLFVGVTLWNANHLS